MPRSAAAGPDPRRHVDVGHALRPGSALALLARDELEEATRHWIDELEATTARRGIRELLLYATVYRARLGEPGALEAARTEAAQIENPALEALLATAGLTEEPRSAAIS